MKYLVQVKQNLAACDTILRGPLNRTLSEDVFNTNSEATKFYNQKKLSFKFSGLAGQYVTFPVEVSDDYLSKSLEALEKEYDQEVDLSSDYEEPYYDDNY